MAASTEKVYIAAVVDEESPLCSAAINCLRSLENRRNDVKFLLGKKLEQFTDDPSFDKINAAVFVPPGPSEVLGQLCDKISNLKWIHSWFVGVDSIAWLIRSKLLDRDISITNARGAFSNSLSEWVLCVCLHFEKQIPRIMQNTANKTWDSFTMGQLEGKTLGFLGFGDLAKKSAAIGKAFRMKTIAVRRDNSKQDHVGLLDEIHLFSEDGLNKVMKEADFVVSVLPGTADTFNLIGAEHFAIMKKTAVFISIGRGTVIQEEQLAEALKNNVIKGAALDVFHKEPLPPDSPLWSLHNIIITAHNADRVESYHFDSLKILEKNLDCFLNGAPEKVNFATPVNKKAGY